MKSTNPIEAIINNGGLPPETWPRPAPLQNSSRLHTFSLDEAPLDGKNWVVRSTDLTYCSKIVKAVDELPAALVLGQAVLIRPVEGITMMVTIAEAACASFGAEAANLLWLLLRTLEMQLRLPYKEHLDRIYAWSWKEDMTREEPKLEPAQQRMKSLVITIAKQIEVMCHSDILWTQQGMWDDLGRVEKKEHERLCLVQDRIKKKHHEVLRLVQDRSFGSITELALDDMMVTLLRFGGRLNELRALQRQSGSKDIKSAQIVMSRHLEVIEKDVELMILSLRGHSFSGNAKPGLPSETTSDLDKTYPRLRTCLATALKTDRAWKLYLKHGYLQSRCASLLNWLEMSLGGHPSQLLADFPCPENFRLEAETEHLFITEREPPLQNCWRNKFVSGNILSLAPIPVIEAAGKQQSEGATRSDTSIVSTLADRFPDSLALTARALWALFDNQVIPRTNCICTFSVPGDAFLQLKDDYKGWLVWHFVEDVAELNACDGRQCQQRAKFSLNEENSSQRLLSNTPCILGWSVEVRSHPSSPLWDTLPVPIPFKKRVLTSYNLNEIHVQAQLSAPVLVSPMIGGQATFAKRQYVVKQSIGPESLLALEAAAVASVLIYDESRQIHLLCEGADIIETICVNYLRDLGLDISDSRIFSHRSARSRLKTWYYSTFTSLTGREIPGTELVRQATKIIGQLCEVNKECFKASVPYWPLEEILRGGTVQPIKRPRAKQASWETLANHSPPLILAVGSIYKKLLHASDAEFVVNGKVKRMRRLFSFADPDERGVIADFVRMKIWLDRANIFQNLNLYCSEELVQFSTTDQERVLKIKNHENGDQDHHVLIKKFCSTSKCTPNAQCVHMIR